METDVCGTKVRLHTVLGSWSHRSISHIPNGRVQTVHVRSRPSKSQVFRRRWDTMCVQMIHLYVGGSDETEQVSVGFFDDIYVPTIYLPEPSAL